MAQQAQQFGLSLGEQETARLEDQRLRSRELGDITRRADADRAIDERRLTQQAQQFGLDLSEQEAARLQQAGQFDQTAGLAREQFEKQQAQEMIGRILGTMEGQPADQRALLGYGGEDNNQASADVAALMQILGLR